MPRPKSPVPAYRLHRPSGQAVVTVRQAEGSRKDVYLGVHGSEESRAEYVRIVGRIKIEKPSPAPPPPPTTVSVAEVVLAFLKHAQAYYVHPDGRQTSEYVDCKYSIRELKQLYAHLPDVEFGPVALKSVRQAMIDAGLCRNVVNQRIGRIRRVFKWAAAEERVPSPCFKRSPRFPGSDGAGRKLRKRNRSDRCRSSTSKRSCPS